MKIAIHLAHPAHYHLFKRVVDDLVQRHDVVVTYNEKDVLGRLVADAPVGTRCLSIRAERKGRGAPGLIYQFLRKEVNLFRVAARERPDVILGTSVIVAHVGFLLRIPSIIVNEDDFDVVAGTARIGYPFASHILAPACCRTGRWADKVVAYESYHELAYLAPRHFTPDPRRLAALGVEGDEPFFVLRFAELGAHHDFGKKGIDADVARGLVDRLQPHGRVFITAERPLEPMFEPLRLGVAPQDIHHVLALARMYIGDSQTMAAEAAVLGTPSLRYNDFVGRISYLEELEHRYGLTFGIATGRPEALFARVEALLAEPALQALWEERRARMLADKVDLAAFMAWFIEHYPQSADVVREAPETMAHFRIREAALV